MAGFLDYLFGAASYVPHGYCLLWRPDLVAMHAIADVTIAASYFSIPAAIYVFIKKRRDIAFDWIAWLFVGFIAACGLTHLLGLITLWHPVYGLQGLVKLGTAGISLVTAALLWPLLPKLLALPSPAQLAAVNQELAQSNQRREEFIEELQVTNRDLERSNRDLDDFAYIASHDLREPLRAVYSHTNIVLEEHKDALGEDGENRLNRVIALSRRLDDLTSDLLQFSRLGRAELAPEPLDIAAIVAEIETAHAELLEERHARIEIVGDLPPVTANRAQITTLFQNLIVNGVKYNDSDEKVIEIGHLPSVSQGGERYADVFFVRDNGIGIKDMFKEDVFRIFKRLNKNKTYGEGTGAGLTFVKKIVENHGGSIWLESTFGEGTTFNFTLKGIESCSTARPRRS